MSSYTLSGEADADLEAIAKTAVKQWGLARAETYMLALHQTFRRLAAFPDTGRDVSHIRPGYLQMATAGHAVFYRKTDNGILIVRVLHQRMDFTRHL